jgi:Leucine-rich repeat (LRR) protein
MKTKLFYLFLFSLLSLGMKAQVVNFISSNFKTRLLSASPSNEIAKNLSGNYFKIDANNDGEIQLSEAQQVSELRISAIENAYITNITGILSFTNLEYLDIIYEKIPNIDLHGLSKLKLFRYYPNTAIVLTNTSLNIEGTNLESLEIPGFRLSSLNVLHCPNLKVLDYSVNPGLAVNLQALPQLQILKCGSSDITSLNLQGLNNLVELYCYYNNITNLDVLHLSNLKILNCRNNPLTNLDVHGLSKLEQLNFSNHIVVNLNAKDCIKLNNFSSGFDYSGYIPTLKIMNLENCVSLPIGNIAEYARYLEYLNVKDTPISELNVNNLMLNYLNVDGCTNLKSLICSYNNLTTLNVQDCTNLRELDCSHNQLTSLDLHGMNIIGEDQSSNPWGTFIAGVNCSNNQITNLNIDNLTTNFLDCSNNNISSLNTQALTFVGIPGVSTANLKSYLNCSHNQLSSLNVKENLVLGSLDCSYNNLNSLNINKMNALRINASHNHLTSLNIDSFSRINALDFSFNNMTSFELHTLPKVDQSVLEYNIYSYPSALNCSNNLLNTINLQGLRVENLNCSNNLFTTLDLNETITDSFNADNNSNLKYLLMKNGVFDNVSINENPNLEYICLDDDIPSPYDPLYTEKQQVIEILNYTGQNNVSVNTYCNFVPGGNYNTITGTVRFDENSNGCDANDEIFEHMKLKINDGTNTGETFVKSDGTYSFFTQEGNFTVTAEPENASLYTITPSTFNASFTNNNNHISTQNICVTKNGNVKDLEIIIAPITNARPGFDSVYKLIWRNKGNTTLSGKATLTFDNTRMTFISSVLPSTLTGNQVSFDFVDLKPYGNTASEIIFNINPPTHPSNPVNINDILNFSANIAPLSGDANPLDNSFQYQETVVGSFDPNDIICLEGDVIPVSMVGKDLHYIINFENTGTAPAENIVVEMDINADDFDINSLQLQNTSHETYTKITGNQVKLIMKNINLAASAHGNIALKMKTKNHLVSGDNVMNKANIYFDYNFPIETNEAITNINNITLATTDVTKVKDGITVYPNPTKGDVNINADSKIDTIEIYDAQGRIIQKQMGINSQSTKISLHNAMSGIYIFKIITEKEIVIKKVIKN